MKRHDPNKTRVKIELFEIYGCKCMVCQRIFEKELLQIHHLEKWHDTHITTLNGSSLVCECCHHNINYQEIHNFKEYERINNQIRKYKQSKR